MPSLELHIDGSTPFAVFLALASLLALLAAALLPVLASVLLLPVVVLASLSMAKRQVLANAGHSPRRIERLANGRWRLGLRSGAVVDVEQLPGAFIHRSMVIARFQRSSAARKRIQPETFLNSIFDRRQQWVCCVPATKLNSDQHRVLRTLLRQQTSSVDNSISTN